MQKDLDITSPEGLKTAVADVRVHGDPNFWVCISKASSKQKGWMHSTKVALVRGQGLLVQTSTELAPEQGSRQTSQALTLVPGAYLYGRTVGGDVIYEMRNSTTGDRVPGSFYLDGVRQLNPLTEECSRGA